MKLKRRLPRLSYLFYNSNGSTEFLVCLAESFETVPTACPKIETESLEVVLDG